MKIVIDIPDKAYGVIKYFESALDSNYKKEDKLSTILIKAVLNGTPLPKGHGRLIDVSDLMPDSDYEDGLFYAVSIGQINLAPTIIEADKAESEEV